jgi:REP element-mobilizing transposase RayT
MPRKPRIEIAGYYHVINRGVEQRVIFKEAEDYEKFEALLCTYAPSYGVTIHNYCLMSNHYHLLIEIKEGTLSKYMRQINMNYAIYFNKKYKRSGHLWQGRFKSWYVTDEAYLYTLILYIEQNPLKANMVKSVDEYLYSTAHYFLSEGKLPLCLKNSYISENYQNDKESIRAFLSAQIDSSILQELKKGASLVEAPNIDKKPNEEELSLLFENITEIKERNSRIVQAYQDGYSQHMIAKVLGLAQPTVNGIIKRTKGTIAIT